MSRGSRRLSERSELLQANGLTDQLVSQLVGEIVSGALPQDSPLPSEPELATRFGVSKIAVREALRVLAALRLIHVRQGRRGEVLNEREWNVLSPIVLQRLRDILGRETVLGQLYEARLILEPAAAALAAARATDEGVQALSELVDQMRAIANGSKELRAFLQLDRKFHDGIATLIDNSIVRAMTRDLHAQMVDNWSDSRITSSDLPGLVDAHAAILEALARGDPESARTSMERHIRTARESEIGAVSVDRPTPDSLAR